MTEWRAIPGFGDYEVSDQGQVRRAVAARTSPVGKLIAPWTEENGYRRISLRAGGKTTKLWLHRVVCFAFHGAPPTPEHEAAHDNGIKADNRGANLAWKTPLENAADSRRHGVIARGQRHPAAKLSDDDVRSILSSAPTYGDAAGLAAAHGVSRQRIYDLRKGRVWRHLTQPGEI